MMPFAVTWMDPKITIVSEVSQTKTNIIHYHFYVCGILKMDTNELICKTEIDSQM